MSTTEVRVRFAPSPTGYLHIGGARTALFTYLFAKHCGGTFILRIEDTDRERYKADACTEIYESLRWLGLQWDEGPEIEGTEYGPYIQSQRLNLYQTCANKLIENGSAYRCFCSAERLRRLREEQEKSKTGQLVGYDRHCRNLSESQSNAMVAEGRPFVVRLKIPLGRTVAFEDLIRGPIECKSDSLDDLVLLKSDGFPTYHLANVVDDHFMKISHVTRGEEWISSTPRHILIYEAFGWEPPKFAHFPVILSADGGKLSKRKGAASVIDFKRAGYLSDALFNFLALLGWSPADNREKMSRQEIIEAFSLEKVSPKAAVFDEKKLEWLNGQYLAECKAESLLEDVAEQLRQKGLLGDRQKISDSYITEVIKLLKDRSRRVNEIVENGTYFFVDPITYEEKAEKKYFTSDTAFLLSDFLTKLESLEPFSDTAAENLLRNLCEQKGISAGKLIHPIRLAVSGVSYGPGLFEILQLLGKETVVRRLKLAVDYILKKQS